MLFTLVIILTLSFATPTLVFSEYKVIQLTNNEYEDKSPEINDSGQVVWKGYDGYDYEIFLYDGANVIQVTLIWTNSSQN
jgi:hypothetical protein